MDSTARANIVSRVVAAAAEMTTFQLTQHLQAGLYRLVIVAPFGTRILVTPLTVPLGFQFQADADPAPEIWNSLIVSPAEGEYTFLIAPSQPVEGTLHVQFVYQAAPPANPPAPAPPVPAPPAPAPPAPPSDDMQQVYRERGYRIAGDGAVEYYYVSFRTDLRTGARAICMEGLFAYSNVKHDPARALQSMPTQDAQYRYNRAGPFPNRVQAEGSALQFAVQLFGDPTRYGIWGTGGLQYIQTSDYRPPEFR